jgi:hypothetical protein
MVFRIIADYKTSLPPRRESAGEFGGRYGEQVPEALPGSWQGAPVAPAPVGGPEGEGVSRCRSASPATGP